MSTKTGRLAMQQEGSRRRKRQVTVKPGFRQDLIRTLRAMDSAGLSISRIVIANGKHRITVTPSDQGIIHAASGWLLMREACAYGKFGRTHAYELIAAGTLHSKKLGTKTLVSKASIDRFLKRLPRKR